MVSIAMANEQDPNPFAEYLWMGEMDQFDEEINAEIEEEYKEEQFIMSCIGQLLDEEEEQTVYYQQDQSQNELVYDSNSTHELQFSGGNQFSLSSDYDPFIQDVTNMVLNQEPYQNEIYENKPVSLVNGTSAPEMKPTILQTSTLNPNAATFVMNPNAKVFVPSSSKHPVFSSTCPTSQPSLPLEEAPPK